MSDPRFRVTSAPLDVNAVAAIVSSADCGAVATFVGLVRNENGGRRVLWLEYEADEPTLGTPAWSLPPRLRIVPRRLPRVGTRSSGSSKLRRSGSTSTSRGA